MPSLRNATAHLESISLLKINEESASQWTQPLAWISASIWPGPQPA